LIGLARFWMGVTAAVGLDFLTDFLPDVVAGAAGAGFAAPEPRPSVGTRRLAGGGAASVALVVTASIRVLNEVQVKFGFFQSHLIVQMD